MSLSPEFLLSNVSRQRFIKNVKELPVLTDGSKISKSAVLVPMCIHNGKICLIYTLRSLNLSTHKGQVSFPGGKIDPGENVVETALRETEEEIGIPREDVDVWSVMPQLHGANSDMVITPVVGFIKNFDFNKLERSTYEVDEIFTVPMEVLCKKENHAHLMYENVVIPVFRAKHYIWGITGFITHFFLQTFLSSEVYDIDFFRKKYTMEDLLPSKL